MNVLYKKSKHEYTDDLSQVFGEMANMGTFINEDKVTQTNHIGISDDCCVGFFYWDGLKDKKKAPYKFAKRYLRQGDDWWLIQHRQHSFEDKQGSGLMYWVQGSYSHIKEYAMALTNASSKRQIVELFDPFLGVYTVFKWGCGGISGWTLDDGNEHLWVESLYKCKLDDNELYEGKGQYVATHVRGTFNKDGSQVYMDTMVPDVIPADAIGLYHKAGYDDMRDASIEFEELFGGFKHGR